MELLLEKVVIYSVTLLLCLSIVAIYLYKKWRESRIVDEKIRLATESGLHEPVSLHPFIDPNRCIQTGACYRACPEHDIIGVRNGKATVINASLCIGHGACFHACPTEAISLRMGTEKRGVDIPHVDQNFETNVPGVYIAGELGGMGLIRNAVEQGRQAAENIAKSLNRHHSAAYDLLIVGAGPAGISAALAAKKHNLNFLLLEQDTLGGTVYTFPRKKIIMTSPMDLPLYGKVRLFETTKSELLNLWITVLEKNQISVRENSKVDSVTRDNGIIRVSTAEGEQITAASVLLAIGRRGTPRKLNIPGEAMEKVAYRLLEPEAIKDKDVIVVGGGDSAIESALLLATDNNVIVSYRGEVLNRLKPVNRETLNRAVNAGTIDLMLNSNLILIEEDSATLSTGLNGETITVHNDLVYIFAGGELPSRFLEKAGVKIEKKFGQTVLKHPK